MTVYTQRFEIAWVIRSMLGQFENMVTMAFDVFDRGIALLANSAVTLKYKLLEWKPQINRHSAVPRKSQTGQFIYCESCHALPDLAVLNLTWTYLTEHRRAIPNPSPPYLALHNQNVPDSSSPLPQRHYIAMPYPLLPFLTSSELTKPDTARANITEPLPQSSILVDLEADYIESAKARAIVANADSLTSLNENVLKQGMIDLVINHADFKAQLPTWCECWPDANNATALYDNRTHVEVKRLITIGVKFFWNHEPFMRDSLRVYEYISLKQILVSLTAFSNHLKGYRSLNQCAFDVAGWLKDLSGAIRIEVFSPFLRIVFRPGGLVSTFAHGFKFGQRIPMLNQRGNAFDLTTDRVHGILLSTIKHKAVALRSPYSCHGTRSLRKATAVCWRIKNAESRDISIIALYEV